MADGGADPETGATTALWPIRSLDERASVAVAGLLTLVASYMFGVVAIPAALFLLRDHVGRRTVIWGSLASACVSGVFALGPAYQWWRARGSLPTDYDDLSSIDLSTIPQVLPLVAAAIVLVLCLAALNRRPADEPPDDTTVDPNADRLFATIDLAVILVTLAYLLVVQPYWFLDW